MSDAIHGKLLEIKISKIREGMRRRSEEGDGGVHEYEGGGPAWRRRRTPAPGRGASAPRRHGEGARRCRTHRSGLWMKLAEEQSSSFPTAAYRYTALSAKAQLASSSKYL